MLAFNRKDIGMMLETAATLYFLYGNKWSLSTHLIPDLCVICITGSEINSLKNHPLVFWLQNSKLRWLKVSSLFKRIKLSTLTSSIDELGELVPWKVDEGPVKILGTAGRFHDNSVSSNQPCKWPPTSTTTLKELQLRYSPHMIPNVTQFL